MHIAGTINCGTMYSQLSGSNAMTYPSGIQSWGLLSIGESLDAEDLLGAMLEVDFEGVQQQSDGF